MFLSARSGLALYLLVLYSLALTGCSAAHTPVIAVIPETTAQELWASEHAGVESVARQYKWHVYWNAPSRQDDIARQIQIVNQEIGRHVDGLILSPDQADALISSVRGALVAGIPTVIVDSQLNFHPDPHLHLVANNENEDGRLAAQRAELYLKPNSSIAVLGVDPNLPGLVERADALEREIHEAAPHVKIIEKRQTSFNFAEEEAAAEEVIRSDHQLRVIVSLNVNQTRAAFQALITTGTLHRIKLIGCGQDLDLMAHLRTGGIDAIVAENTYRMGVDAMHIIRSVRSGHEAPNLVIQPVLITRKNIDTPAVQQLLSMDWTAK